MSLKLRKDFLRIILSTNPSTSINARPSKKMIPMSTLILTFIHSKPRKHAQRLV